MKIRNTAESDNKGSSPFGVLLRRWRHVRGQSQLSLAYLSNTSPRHISFLETGRARPGKDLILQLAKVLHLSMRDVNSLMVAAGFPNHYPEDKLGASLDMAPFRKLIDSLVHGNERLPCCVVDRWWRIQDANRGLRALFKSLEWEYETPDHQDIVDRILGQNAKAAKLINLSEVTRQFIVRLRSEMSLEDDEQEIEKLAQKAEGLLQHEAEAGGEDLGSLPLTLNCQFQVGAEIFRAVVGISRFGAAPHVELSELRFVWFIPADKESEALLERLMQNLPQQQGGAVHARLLPLPAAAAATH
jgi:transcriptional regulator with XRE-family HTH domain